VNNPAIPDVILPASDHRRLERLAQVGADQGDADAGFRLSEINRAEIVPDRAARLDSIVTMGSWVTFWITWGCPRETKCTPKTTRPRTQIPLMSPLGAALVRAEGRKRNPLLHRWAHQRRPDRTRQSRWSE
jgi:regulator of nucleoside diphosphate kinase